MLCISKIVYYNQATNILDAQKEEACAEIARIGQRLSQSISKESNQSEEDQLVDAAVSFDGTWVKRGFKSLIGVAILISVDTGEVFDYCVLSKTCQKCSQKTAECEGDDGKLEEWREPKWVPKNQKFVGTVDYPYKIATNVLL